ncbi:MAG: bifunctional UDP-N-acetylglucosamine diphosphorylase/glucosamine-1-phosphate N-acetyltransferase GlmU [Sulfuricella denitrificans]|nr:bifunctional UDP-N-acetylglucosamine diphosphorylase/glucosamine-1-phosphate N-acetyltransferase GlmU [Sulfuricella denitrificans]
MPQALDIVVLAAGKGTRMVSERPKVLHEIAGKSLLRHVLDTIKALDPEQICVVYGYGGEAVPQAIADPSLKMVKQEPQLGTGHAVQQALHCLHEDHVTLVLYGDVPLTRIETLLPLIRIAQGGKVGLLTVEMKNPYGYGRIVREGGKVRRIVEEKDASAEERKITEVNTGIMALPNQYLPGWLAALKNCNVQSEYYLTDVIGLAVSDGIEVATAHPAHHREVLGVNSKSQLAQLERMYQQEQAHKLLDGGVTLLDPERIDIRGTLVCGKDVVIDINCVFEGHVKLGDGVKVGANCVVRDVTIEKGCNIEPFSLLEKATMGADCRIGPFARIRPGTQLAEEVHIGNFVEVKNSQVGFNSKINHLSYIGDATVGAKVNVGAGAITCNYDGANKHRTVIEDGAFIGSDTQLVAPVTIARGATIGAGSTITKDTPEDELTLSRARQITIRGWKRPVKKAKE